VENGGDLRRPDSRRDGKRSLRDVLSDKEVLSNEGGDVGKRRHFGERRTRTRVDASIGGGMYDYK